MPQPPLIAHTSDDALGRRCPYCQTALLAGDVTATCGDCRSVLHGECWGENGGCAIPGCASSPETLVQAAPPAPEVVTPVAAAVGAAPAIPGTVGALAEAPAPAVSGTRFTIAPEAVGLGSTREPARGGGAQRPAPPRAAPRSPGSRRGWWIAAVIVLLLAAALAVILTGGETAAPQPGGATGSVSLSRSGDGVSASESVSRAAIAGVVRDYLADLADDTDAGRERALALLSDRKQAVLRTSEANGRWLRAASLVALHVREPRSAQVTRIVNYPGVQQYGIAEVRIAGPRWDGEPGCGTFSGTIWAVHTGDEAAGEWRLEPGYDTTESRRTRFRDPGPRATLLGATCLGTAL